MQGAISMFQKIAANAVTTLQASSVVQGKTESSRAAHKMTFSKSRLVFSWSRMKLTPQNTAQH